MRVGPLPWRLAAVWSAIAAWQTSTTNATPSVNVALRASFNAAPYLLELLETAAEENRSSYFPLLDRIADGYFTPAKTDQALYTQFLQVVQDEGHITDPTALSSFQFALSIRAAAPRIEAHYQFYETAVVPTLGSREAEECDVWIHFGGKQYCSPSLEKAQGGVTGEKLLQKRQFDRILGNETSQTPSILYADINSPSFSHFHRLLSETAKAGKTSYRVRYKTTGSSTAEPLPISGYGVSLPLKRTDYIVIDDREVEKGGEGEGEGEGAGRNMPGEANMVADEEELSDLRPLSTSELLKLGLKASSFVMDSEDPFRTLLEVSQDFPKHSYKIAGHNVSADLLREMQHNRNINVPYGFNVAWINGAQVDPRQFDAFALSQHLRRERRLITGFQSLGLSGREAVRLLGHPAIAEAKDASDVQRYDIRDEVDGGAVILWMNNLERDKRYQEWPSSVTALLRPTYPGQLPALRRDLHTLVVPVDLTVPDDVTVVVEQLQSFVMRKIPIRFGVVPIIKTPAAEAQAKIVYHLADTYGLSAVLAYLTSSLTERKLARADAPTFEAVIKGRNLRRDRTASSFQDALDMDHLSKRIGSVRSYNARLGVDSAVPPFFVNGAVFPRDDNWLSAMSHRVNMDLQSLQVAVYEERIGNDTWLPSFFIGRAAARRNDLIVPVDDGGIEYVDFQVLLSEHGEAFATLPNWTIDEGTVQKDWVSMIVVADMNSAEGLQLVQEAINTREKEPELQITVLHNSAQKSRQARSSTGDGEMETDEAKQALAAVIGFTPGQNGLVVNGRVVGPIPPTTEFGQEEIRQLLAYERGKRSSPVYTALDELELLDKLDEPLTMGKLVSLIALSTVSDLPDGIFDSPPKARVSAFEQWRAAHSAIVVGEANDATIHIVAAVDPASEITQRWVPILKVLSELDGVYVKIFLNPKERLQELPVKRFYRHVLASKPSFDDDGAVKSPIAHFTGLPTDALFNVAMDVPPSWLVAPKASIHDLDNIKLSSLRDQLDIEAVYELQHILIEGHSRDVTIGQPPRGAQLLLGTDKEPAFADTLIMANLGYFQFKANPGFWKMELKAGRSQEIFHIDSAGSQGYGVHPGDNSTEIELLSFQGNTLFPRLSRKPGQEMEDVLETGGPKSGSALDYVTKGLKFAEGVFSSGEVAAPKAHADINIFSVASGHLYERMLNIMMVSVMKHTKHTVKF
ncbi:MAG: hypothetical protein M1838_005007, partial [Thelocarpon superellum]